MGICSFLFVLIPISGGVVLNPILSLIVDPHTALSLSVFFFMLNSGIKAIVFMKDIQMRYVLFMMPVSLIASALGSYVVGIVPEFFLYLILLVMTVWFALKRLGPAKWFRQGGTGSYSGFLVAGGLGGFMQGTGLGGGGSLRKAYFLSEAMTIQQMHGTTSALSVAIGLASILVRVSTDQVEIQSLYPMLFLIPVMLVATFYGKKVLAHISDKVTETIVTFTLVAMVVMLAFKIF